MKTLKLKAFHKESGKIYFVEKIEHMTYDLENWELELVEEEFNEEGVREYGNSIECNGLDVIFIEFTGFFDKNSKEIYRGDIVDTHPVHKHKINCRGKKRFQKVVFDGGSFHAEHSDFGWEGEDVIDLTQCEVIGNIYENPELLK